MRPETMHGFIRRLEEGHVFAIETFTVIWYLEKKENTYRVTSSNTYRQDFDDVNEAILCFLLNAGDWLR